MFKEIVVSIDEREGRAVVLEDGKPVEILIEREDRQVGSIYKGRVSNVLPGMNAAFVDIGLERNGFLCADDAVAYLNEEENESLHKRSISDILKVNQETLVQVVKEAIGTKGARITTYISLPGRYMVLLPSAQYVGVSRRISTEEERTRLRAAAEALRPDGMGIIVRTAAEGHTEQELQADVDYLIKVWKKIQDTSKVRHAPCLIHQELPLVDKIIRDIFTSDVDRMVIDNAEEYAKMRERLQTSAPGLLSKFHLYTDKRPLFDFYGVENEIDKALSKKVWLESGGHLVIDHTEALWVIDVNTGKFIGKNSLSETILKTNLEACREICRQIRLRDMAGIIIIDFIDMDDAADQCKMLDFLSAELKKDRTRTHLVSMTELGLVQLTRKREGKDLDGVMRQTCPVCHGHGKILSAQSIAFKARRELLREVYNHNTIGRHRPDDVVIITMHPQAAWELVGHDGQEGVVLEKGLEMGLRVMCDPAYLPEEFSIRFATKSDMGSMPLLSNGQQAKVIVKSLHTNQHLSQIQEKNDTKQEKGAGEAAQSALAMVNGCLVEVHNGREKVGREVLLRITKAGKFVSRADILRD